MYINYLISMSDIVGKIEKHPKFVAFLALFLGTTKLGKLIFNFILLIDCFLDI